MKTFNTNCNVVIHYNLQGADKSLARPGRIQATFPALYGTWRFITPFKTVHHLSLPMPNQSLPLLITFIADAACVLPCLAKDLSTPLYSEWVYLLIFFLISECFSKYLNSMMRVALYFRFCILYTSVYLHNLPKRKERKHAGWWSLLPHI